MILQGHTGPLRTARFSDDDHRVVTASDDATARIWSAAGGQALTLLRGMIFGVLRKIAVQARFPDRGNHGRPLHGLQTLQLFVEGVIALGGHRDFIH